MGGCRMKVRVLKTFRGYKKGQVFNNWSDGMARIFIARGMVEEIRDADLEFAVLEQRTEQAVAAPSRKKK